MSEPDSKIALREFKQYLDLSYESPREFAARIGVTKETIWYWLSGRRQPKAPTQSPNPKPQPKAPTQSPNPKPQPKAPSLAKLRRFLDAEAKRPLQGDGITPIEGAQYKIIMPIQQVRYARLCPFCRKEQGKIRKQLCMIEAPPIDFETGDAGGIQLVSVWFG